MRYSPSYPSLSLRNLPRRDGSAGYLQNRNVGAGRRPLCWLQRARWISVSPIGASTLSSASCGESRRQPTAKCLHGPCAYGFHAIERRRLVLAAGISDSCRAVVSEETVGGSFQRRPTHFCSNPSRMISLSLFRRFRTWCPACYEGWRASGRSVYEPLLWSLRVASVCPLHRRSLISVCPHCERPIRPIMSSSRPGYCGRCGGWLGAMPDGPLPEELSPASSNYWVSNAAGELLALAPRASESPTITGSHLARNHTTTGRDHGSADAERSKQH